MGKTSQENLTAVSGDSKYNHRASATAGSVIQVKLTTAAYQRLAIRLRIAGL